VGKQSARRSCRRGKEKDKRDAMSTRGLAILENRMSRLSECSRGLRGGKGEGIGGQACVT